MNLQKSENPASAPVFHLNADPEARPGGRWTDRQLSFGLLQARDALQLTYVFYEWEAEVYPGFMGEPWLHISSIIRVFVLEIGGDGRFNLIPDAISLNRLAYAIQLEKRVISRIGCSIHSAEFVEENIGIVQLQAFRSNRFIQIQQINRCLGLIFRDYAGWQ